MRLRFFLVTSLAVFWTAICVSFIHLSFIQKERLTLIDQQIRQSASVLVNSELGILKKINFKKAEEIISEELGPKRIGKIFVIRNGKDEVVFQSGTLDFNLPRHPQWVTIQTPQFFVRILNLDLPKLPDRTLQVGLVLDPNFLSWTFTVKREIGLIFLIVFLTLVVAGLMTIYLLAPFRQLIAYLSEIGGRLTKLKGLPPLPIHLNTYKHGFGSRSDEFAQLLEVVHSLVERINSSYKVMRVWSAEMAHELKTPLTVLKTNLESAQAPSIHNNDLIKEIDLMANTINDFLSWAEIQHSDFEHDLHVFDASKNLREICNRFEKYQPGRIRFEMLNSLFLVAPPIHFEHLMTNLIGNAFKYSPEKSPVEILVKDSCISVSDHGGGIPGQVLSLLGQPFNRGQDMSPKNKASTGLGLAIATSIVKLYGWEMIFQRDETIDRRAKIIVDFKSSLYQEFEDNQGQALISDSPI